MAAFFLPKRYQRLVAARRTPYELTELAARTWQLLAALRSVDVLFDLFRGEGADFEVCPAEHEAAVLRLLSASAIDWYDIPRPPREPAYRARLVNFGAREAYADLMLSWVSPGEVIEGRAPLAIELRIGEPDEAGASGKERGALLTRAFGELVRHFAVDVAVAEPPMAMPAVPAGDLAPTVEWLTFVPARLSEQAHARSAPLRFIDAADGGAIAVACDEPPFWDQEIAAVVRLRSELLPVLEGRDPRIASSEPREPVAPRGQAVPSYLQPAAAPPIVAAPAPAKPSHQVACFPADGAAMDGLVWRRAGQEYLTVALKLCFDLTTGALATSEPLVTADRFLMGDANRSVLRANELVPYLPRAEIVVLGYAEVALGKTTLTSLKVQNPALLLSKEVMIRPTGKEGEDPCRVPLIYEGAFGGPGFDRNPVGMGHRGSGIPTLLPPDLSLRLVGYGPLSPFWQQRTSLLVAGDRAELAKSPVEVPARLSFDYFHAAPLDQRFPEFLRGDETIVLEGFRAAPLELKLPSVSAVAFVQGLGAGRTTLPLALDMVVVDLGRARASIVLRGCCELPSGAATELVASGGFALNGKAYSPSSQANPEAEPAQPSLWDEETAGPGTLVGAVAPFPIPEVGAAPAAQRSALPWANAPATPPAASPLAQTIDLSDDAKKRR